MTDKQSAISFEESLNEYIKNIDEPYDIINGAHFGYSRGRSDALDMVIEMLRHSDWHGLADQVELLRSE